jgi:hypothetical protein
MATTGSDSSLEMDSHLAHLGGGDAGPSAAAGTIWLDGDVLACSCPDCGAPMSIRLWLLVADCFRCGASIELTEEQEREAMRLLREQEQARRTESQEAIAAITPTVARKPKPRSRSSSDVELLAPAAGAGVAGATVAAPAARAAGEPGGEAAAGRARQRRVAAAEVYRGPRARVRNLYEKGSLAVFFGDLLKNLPAWLVSLIVHAILLILLSIWFADPAGDWEAITLATSTSHEDIVGEQGKLDESPEAFEFDTPGAVELVAPLEEFGMTEEPQPDVARVEMAMEVRDPIGRLPSTATRSMLPQVPMAAGRMFAGRDPAVRAQQVRRAGGTSATEAAVARALVFLARHQRADGSWGLHDWNRTPDCDDTCRQQGGERSDVAATALALLPFLGAGQTHLEGQHAPVVFKALGWLAERQKEDGGLLDGGNMYAHGQAAIALCEAYALSGDDQLREPAQRALNFIVRAQHARGGWRYQPGQPGDTSVVGWQLMALKSGQMGYLYVPAKTFELAALFLDDVQTDEVGGRYAYQPRGRPTPTMTAEALLCRQYLGWTRDHPGLRSGVEYLLEEHLPDANVMNLYYYYYATQVMHHYGGPAWTKWNARMRDVLLQTQEKHGHAAGSWAPRGEWSNRGGRIYQTALAACILEVYYRHMPLYSDEALAIGLEGFD